MTEFLRERCTQHRTVTYGEQLDSLQFHHEIVLSGDSLRHAVLSMALIKSMDSKRVEVDAIKIDAWDATLAERAEGIPRRFVFNVDEIGYWEYGDGYAVRIGGT
jgi:hypothetical protein